MREVLNKLPRIGDHVFTFKGSRLRKVRTAFAVACQSAKIEDFRFHDLRHGFVTNTRRRGVPDRVIMAITGHTTVECFQRYDAISLDELKQTVGSI